MSDQDVLEALRRVVGEERVLTDEDSLRLAASDLYVTGKRPVAVVRPASSRAVADAVATSVHHGHAVFPRGGGLSYTGGYSQAGNRGITIDLSGMNRIMKISEEDMVITVEAGVTWKQIDDALKPLGLRLPFFGTFSGAGATVGGGLSHGALFFGSARYGSAAETVLELEVALADGTLMKTGQGALQAGSKPILRSFGPDLTGLFVHDGGAFGIKTRASLRMIRRPPAEGFASFAFDDLVAAARVLSEIARQDLAEEVYILDPAAADQVSAAPAQIAWQTVRQAGGPFHAARALVSLAKGGAGPIPPKCFSLHIVAAGRTRSAVDNDLNTAARLARKGGGRAIAPTVPQVARTTRFSDLDGVIDTDGGRWAALNAKVAHSDAENLITYFRDLISSHSEEMESRGVRVTYLVSALANHCFSFEAVFHWRDEWLPLHRQALTRQRLAKVAEPTSDPHARDLVDRLREETVALFQRLGAASNQIGRTYPYLGALSPAPASLLSAIKNKLDPGFTMNPGVIGLSQSNGMEE